MCILRSLKDLKHQMVSSSQIYNIVEGQTMFTKWPLESD